MTEITESTSSSAKLAGTGHSRPAVDHQIAGRRRRRRNLGLLSSAEQQRCESLVDQCPHGRSHKATQRNWYSSGVRQVPAHDVPVHFLYGVVCKEEQGAALAPESIKLATPHR